MAEVVPAWEVPLEAPPKVVAIGRNAHGFVPVDRYRLTDLWSLHLYDYDAVLRLDGREVSIRKGSVGVTPPGVGMETRYFGVSVHVYAHFRLAPGPTRRVKALADLREGFAPLYARLYEASGCFSREPRWADARVWDALWTAASLAESPSLDAAPVHRAVRHATEIIERGLDRPIAVVDLARAVEVHPTHLGRLFRDAYGTSVVGFVRARRMARASDLLRGSSLPVKLVAAAAGFPDLQSFNKAVRAEFGVGPRAWRERSGDASLEPPTKLRTPSPLRGRGDRG